VSYAYDIVGSLKSVTYPSGRIVAQSFDTLERLTQVSSSSDLPPFSAHSIIRHWTVL
jgi:hypothetical protein